MRRSLTLGFRFGQDTCAVVEMCRRKTVCTSDVVWALHRQGRTIYVSTIQPFDKMKQLPANACVGLWIWRKSWSEGVVGERKQV